MDSGIIPGLPLLLNVISETPSKVRNILPADSDVLLLLSILLLAGWAIMLKLFPQLLRELALPYTEKENDFSRIIHVNKGILIGFILINLFIFAFYLTLLFSSVIYRNILLPKHLLELSFLFCGPISLYFAYKSIANYLFSWIFYSRGHFKYWAQSFIGGYLLGAIALFPFLFVALFLYSNELKLLLSVLLIIPVTVVTANAVKSYFIFFGQIKGCLHFILYLCAQEIVPLLLLIRLLDIFYNFYI